MRPLLQFLSFLWPLTILWKSALQLASDGEQSARVTLSHEELSPVVGRN